MNVKVKSKPVTELINFLDEQFKILSEKEMLLLTKVKTAETIGIEKETKLKIIFLNGQVAALKEIKSFIKETEL